MTTIPDHVGREAVRLLNEELDCSYYVWPQHKSYCQVITVAKLLMNPPAPMTDPDEEAARRVIEHWYGEIIGPNTLKINAERLTRATEQMRKEREAWEDGRL